MNERILELAEEATRRYDRLGCEIPFAQPNLELFAQLIINEAALFLNGAVEVYTQAEQDACDRAARGLKRHFGIEE